MEVPPKFCIISTSNVPDNYVHSTISLRGDLDGQGHWLGVLEGILGSSSVKGLGSWLVSLQLGLGVASYPSCICIVKVDRLE